MDINLGGAWFMDEFQGILIADTFTVPDPISTSVHDINANPNYYRFQRVVVQGSYLVTTATVDYSDMKMPIGQGVLADSFGDFFSEEDDTTLETIDPEASVWQLRECGVTGTVIYPTKEILKYLDYSQPLSQAEISSRIKSALIVDSLQDDYVEVASISELNPVTGNPSAYWGKVVELEGYAVGVNYPLKQAFKTVTNYDVPVNVNLMAAGIADGPWAGSQIVIIGLNNDLLDDQGEVIAGKFRFRVAVSYVEQDLLAGIPGRNTTFLLLSKEKIELT